ncbi:TPA: hypothetical protein N0F65_001966 [Lagenidium giganteum]|uniref:Dynamin N-terminal domain-containing protein n=1 Tax=Lagenidium giganteum TaxID=4803 RepID=A0AAV2YNV5_9STRA|nr:TPA: hypothetical protein N0F65_001966 [Lagenidium giganteum]
MDPMDVASEAEVDNVAIAGEVNRMIQVEVNGVYERLEKLRQQCRFPSFETVNIPMVLVLGNHSSGKSTFINHMLGQDVQKTGRAPTDCTFTVMVGGNREERLDGLALTRHPQYGFGEVQRLFGHDFVSQIELKVIEGSKLLDEGGLMIVDSPGMIDPPGASTDRTDTDRGYDFKRVVQWFADRADVVLVMFDPDKPGTTFETLDVLTTSLRDMSSKLLLILNKVDDFHTVHDFARAYGALCWNLSKVIPRKDLPFIYAMYVPRDKQHNASKVVSPSNAASSTRGRRASVRKSLTVSEAAAVMLDDGSDEPLTGDERALANVKKMLEHEFDGTRGEVIREVKRAPDRATDNILNLLKSTMSRLKMHHTLIEACKQEYLDLEKFWKRIQIVGIAAGIGAVAFYLIRTVGSAPPALLEAELIAETKSSTSATAAASASSSGSGSVSSSASSPAPTSSTATSTSSPKLRGAAWKENWARQVAKSRSTFSFLSLFKIALTSCVSNFTIWKWSLVSLESKKERVLQWMPATFRRVYAQHLCKSDRTHDETIALWKSVQAGLKLALKSTPINEFPELDIGDKNYLDDVLTLHIPRLDRCVRDRTGDDHAYLRFKHLDKPSAKPRPTSPANTK